MEDTFTKVEELANSVKEYINNRSELVKLTVAEKTSMLIANLLAILAILMFFTFFIGFGSLALATWLATYMGSTWAAYLIIAGLHLVAAFSIWLLRSKLIRFPVMNTMLKQFFKNDEED